MHGTELGNGDRTLAKQFQQECLEVVIGAIDFVDEQDPPVEGPDGVVQRVTGGRLKTRR